MIEREPGHGWASLFWSAFDRSANSMAVLRPDRVLVAINPAFSESLGYEPDEAVGQLSDLYVAPHWRGRLERDWARLQRTSRLTGKRELVRADGKYVHVQFAAHREDVAGQQLVLYVVLDARLRPVELASLSQEPPKPLTPRELEILGEIAMGRRWHEIAADLYITQSTVKTHVRNAMRKLGARSQAQLVAIALISGMLDPARALGRNSS